MLRNMRTSASSLSIKILLLAIIVSFISFYGYGQKSGQGCNPHAAATVNGDVISLQDYDQRFRGFMEMYRNMGMLKDNINEQMVAMIRSNVLQNLVNERLKSQEAAKIGILPSNEAVKEAIKQQFTRPGEAFDVEFYKKYLSERMHMSPANFEKAEARGLQARMLDDLLVRSTFMSDYELKMTYAAQNQKVNLWYAELDGKSLASKVGPIAAPNDQDIEEHFKSHAADYRTPEKRQLEILWVENNSEGAALIKTAREKADKKPSLENLGLDSKIKFLKTDFVAPGDAVAGIPDGSQISRTVVALKEGGLSQPIKAFLGENYYLARVVKVKASETPPLETVKGKVKDDLIKQRETDGLRGFAERWIAQASAAKTSFEKSVGSLGLKAKETGDFAKSTTHKIPGIGKSETGMTEAFAKTMDAPILAQPIVADGRIYVAALKSKTEPNWTTFETEKENLRKVTEEDDGRRRREMWMDHMKAKSDIRRFVDVGGAAPGQAPEDL